MIPCNRLWQSGVLRWSVRSLVVLAGWLHGSSPAAAQSASCPASASWFSNPSFPAEVPGGANASNCGFQQFAWQAFIDLVQPARNGGALRTFETYMPDYGVFVPDGTAVTPWGQQPDAPCKPGPAAAKLGKQLFLRPRVGKGAGFDPNSDQQATGNPLYDQQKQVVYYSIWINQVEYDFITKCDFNNTSCITSAPATSAITAGAVELKGSWRVFTGAAPTDMYAIHGVVGVVGKDGKIDRTCTPVTLGLVGFHLVVNTPLHPEFIWATFEHKTNAPDCTSPQSAPPGGWSFHNPKCPTSDPSCKPNQPNAAPTPTQVCRVAPEGGGSAENTGNIQAINLSAHQLLAQLVKTAPARYRDMAIWQNYELTGNVWTLNGGLPPTTTNERGSLLAANTTMETFIQGQSSSGADQNCFTCHTEAQFVLNGVAKGFPTGAPANFSHLWGFAQRTGGCGNGKGPLPAACPLPRSSPPATAPAKPR
jgi:hypothetical protein